MRRLLLVVTLLSACATPSTLPDAERVRSAQDLDGQRRFTKVALWAGPFFGDGSRLLVSDAPFAELDLLRDTHGDLMQPPPAERVILPGAAVQIEKVEFPTPFVFARRVVMSPRHHPWVFLRLEGEPRALVVVLPQGLATADDVRLELERVLGTSSPAAALQALPDGERKAIMRKAPWEGMGPQALEMAWGYPERKVIDRPAATEEWSWASGRRKAFLRDGKLVRWEERRGP